MTPTDIHDLARRRAAELRDEALDRLYARMVRALRALLARRPAPMPFTPCAEA